MGPAASPTTSLGTLDIRPHPTQRRGAKITTVRVEIGAATLSQLRNSEALTAGLADIVMSVDLQYHMGLRPLPQIIWDRYRSYRRVMCGMERGHIPSALADFRILSQATMRRACTIRTSQNKRGSATIKETAHAEPDRASHRLTLPLW
jgi:hypothetical protein